MTDLRPVPRPADEALSNDDGSSSARRGGTAKSVLSSLPSDFKLMGNDGVTYIIPVDTTKHADEISALPVRVPPRNICNERTRVRLSEQNEINVEFGFMDVSICL